MGEEKVVGVTDEQEFNRIFDEISGGNPVDGDIPKEEEVIPPVGKGDEAEPKADDIAPDTVAGSNPESNLPQGTTNVDPEPKPEEPDYRSLYDKEVQKTKSWDGRIRAANDRASRAEAEVHRLTIEMGKLQEQGKTPPVPPVSDVSNDPDIKQFFTDYPELIVPFEKLVVTKGAEVARRVVEEKLAALQPMIHNLEKNTENLTVDKHFVTISQKHPDWEEMMNSGEVSNWIEAQPSFYHENLKRVVERGSAEEAIDLLNEVKKSRGTKVSPTPPPTPHKKNPEDIIAVPAGKAEPPKQATEKDFDYWWKVVNKEGK